MLPDDELPRVEATSLDSEAPPAAACEGRYEACKDALTASDEWRALSEGSECLFDVPFSLRIEEPAPGIVRGRIDGLIRRPDRSIAVVRFERGEPREAHRMELDLCVRAAATFFPGAAIEGHLVYAR